MSVADNLASSSSLPVAGGAGAPRAPVATTLATAELEANISRLSTKNNLKKSKKPKMRSTRCSTKRLRRKVPRPRSNKIKGRNLPSFEPKATMNINLREAIGTIRGTYTREELSL